MKDAVIVPEREVVKYVLNFFQFNPLVRVWRRNVGAVKVRDGGFYRFGEPGQSDIFGIISEMRCPVCGRLTGRGVHLEIECKAANGRLSPPQKEFQKLINDMGGIAVTAKPDPTQTDPTGFNAINKQLVSLQNEVCKACAER